MAWALSNDRRGSSLFGRFQASQFSLERFVEDGQQKGVEFGGGLGLQALRRIPSWRQLALRFLIASITAFIPCANFSSLQSA
jgi:hypothetical protein